MNHVYEIHKNCTRDHCPICDGGLSCCTICGGLEGSLTTDCPGVPMWAEYGADVYAGRIDFRAGQWVPEVTVHMAHVYSEKYRP